MLDSLSKRRIRDWFRSPGFYVSKVKDRIFCIDNSTTEQKPGAFEPGTMEWLALTELAFGGLQTGGAFKVATGCIRSTTDTVRRMRNS